MQLEYKENSSRSTFYDMSVRQAAKQATYGDVHSFDTYIRNIEEAIDNIPRKSSGFANNYYKALPVLDGDKIVKVEIWHLDANGDKKRLVATISEKKNTKS